MTRQRTYTDAEDLENTRVLMAALDKGYGTFKITPKHDCAHLGVGRYYIYVGRDVAVPPALIDWSIANGGVSTSRDVDGISPLCTLADVDKLHPHLQLMCVQIRLGAI